MKQILAAVFLATLALSACTVMPDRSPAGSTTAKQSDPFPQSTDHGLF